MILPERYIRRKVKHIRIAINNGCMTAGMPRVKLDLIQVEQTLELLDTFREALRKINSSAIPTTSGVLIPNETYAKMFEALKRI